MSYFANSITPPKQRIDTQAEMLKFIRIMQCVPVEMIRKFFPQFIPDTQIKKQLNALALSKAISVDWPEQMVYASYYNPVLKTDLEKRQQNMIIRAGWILCKYGVQKLQYYHTCLSPLQIEYCTSGNIPCDIAVVNPGNISSLMSVLPRWWKNTIAKGCEDSYIHIAVVPNKEGWNGFDDFIDQVSKIGFQMYATVDETTHNVTMHPMKKIPVEYKVCWPDAGKKFDDNTPAFRIDTVVGDKKMEARVEELISSGIPKNQISVFNSTYNVLL